MKGNAHDADLVALIGATGSGKTLLTKKLMRADARTPLVWSWKEHADRYAPEFGVLVEGDAEQLVQLALDGAAVVYVPRRDDDALVARQFALFCGVALAVGNRAVLVEEMSHVATSRSAPARWRELVTGGRAEGLSLKATTQRPQLCDAALLDGATEIYCGRLQRGGSKKIMADALDVPLDQVRGLLPLQFLHWRVGAGAPQLVAVEPPQKRRRR